MSRLLYEPDSPRGDKGKLVINNRVPVNIPFVFNITEINDQTNKPEPYIISKDEYIKGTLKENISYISKIFEFKYIDIINNTIVFSLDEKQISKLKQGMTYVLGFTLYNNQNKPIKVLIKSLPVYIEPIV